MSEELVEYDKPKLRTLVTTTRFTSPLVLLVLFAANIATAIRGFIIYGVIYFKAPGTADTWLPITSGICIGIATWALINYILCMVQRYGRQ